MALANKVATKFCSLMQIYSKSSNVLTPPWTKCNIIKARAFCLFAPDQQLFKEKNISNTPSALDKVPKVNGAQNIGSRFQHLLSTEEEESFLAERELGSVEDVPERRMLLLRWGDGEEMLFPYIFLRDSCRCPSCYHPFTKARLILMRDLKVDSVPTQVQIDNANCQLLVTWDDGHFSPFDYKWLDNHSFKDKANTQNDNLLHRKPTIWGAELQDRYPTADFTQLMTCDSALYQWLTDIEEFGFCLIRGAATEPGEVERFTKRISFHRTTHYGPTFNVAVNAKPSNLAYTSGTLGLHTDVPYDRHPPGVQFLHCIKQTECSGGENEFSDSFYAAEVLRKDYPEYHRLLTTVPINYIDEGTDYYGDFFKLSRHPIFTKDIEGNIDAIQYSNQARDSFMKQPVDQVEPTIRAIRKLDDILYQNHIRIKLKDGDIASFGNRRVLHGRACYTAAAGAQQQRYLQGAYIDLDEINSKRRVLKKKLNIGLYEL